MTQKDRREYRIAVLPGDGVGHEVMREAVKILKCVTEKSAGFFTLEEMSIGMEAYQHFGEYLPKGTLLRLKSSDAALLGATGVSHAIGKELILSVRQECGLFCNIRPVVSYQKVRDEFDYVIVRELASGIYFGSQEEAVYQGLGMDAYARDTARYTVNEIARVVRIAFALAKRRRKKVTSVDKANVLATSRLWRKVVDDVAKEFSDVEYCHMYVDNVAYQMIKNSAQFDVIVTDNLFGDILSDEAAGLVGSLGLMPSASVRGDAFGLYEPVHGSAPDIAGKGIANPVGMILSAALMLRHSFALEREAMQIEEAVRQVLSQGHGTPDIDREYTVSTAEFGDLVVKYLQSKNFKS